MPNLKIDNNGNKRWYNSDGQLHREDGPAIEWADGTKEWWINGKLHREDGPAFEDVGGYKEYWVNGEQVNKEDVIKQRIMPIKQSVTSGLLKMVVKKHLIRRV